MKQILLTFLLLTLPMQLLRAATSDRVDLFTETFSKVEGDQENPTGLDLSQLDNPEGWDFKNAFAGPGYVIIRKGGSVTLPKIPGLTGNAAFYFEARPTEEFYRENEENGGDFNTVLKLSITDGELSMEEFDPMVSMNALNIYNASSETRVTLHAAYDLELRGAGVYYGEYAYGFLTTGVDVSQPEGEYYSPFDLTLTGPSFDGSGGDGSRNIILYTTDGTKPTRTSTPYDGSPIRISSTTELATAVIFANGAMFWDDIRTYSFPEVAEIVKPEFTFDITLPSPGSLKNAMLDVDADVIEGLILHGKLNSADLKYLIAAEGRAGALTYLDLTDVTLEYDDGHYNSIVFAPEGGMGNSTTVHFFLCADNWVEQVGASPTSATYNSGRNDLTYAFARHPRLAHISLPSCMKEIGSNAFSRVATATLPDGLEVIGDEAFRSCTNINLPASLRVIGSGAFGPILGEVDLPALEYLGDNAFSGSHISSFKFYDNLTHIGSGAFASTALTEVNIPAAPDTIPAGVFQSCSFLEKVNIEGNSTVLGSYAFAGCDAIKEFNIPSTIEEVGANAIPDHLLTSPEDGIIYFGKAAYRCVTYDAEYTIKEGTVSLTEDLFNGNYNLTKVNLPASLRRIGERAFSGTALTSTPAMEGVTHIGGRAFADCRNLARVVIPESMEYMGWGVFLMCDNIWNVTYNAVFARFEDTVSELDLRDVERVTIGDKVCRVPAGLFTDNTNVTEAVLPPSVQVLAPNVFSGCKNLEYVEISDNVSKISDNAFFYCESLKDLHWPLHLDSIGSHAFHGCKSLTVVSLPEGIRSVAEYAFYGCENVNTLYIASTLYDIEPGAFEFYTNSGLTVSCTAEIPPRYEWHWREPATIKVPAEYMESYRTEPYWNGEFSNLTNEIIALGEIAASTESTSTGFSSGIDDDTDLTDAVVGGVYVTVGESDSYDSSDGSIVLHSTMTDEQAEAIGGMAPGRTDLGNRFNGLVTMVPAGSGTIIIEGLTTGTKSISVKIGENAPRRYTQNSKGVITVDYDVMEDTYVYIFGSEQTPGQATAAIRPMASEDYVKIYSVGVSPEKLGIEGISSDSGSDSPVTDYYTIDGIRVETPTAPGLYIVRRADGSTSKIILR